MLEHIDISQILFFDIETVCQKASLEELSDSMQEQWRYKAAKMSKLAEGDVFTDEDAALSFKGRAALYAEFGKIICISVGVAHPDKGGSPKVRLKSFAGHDEKQLLIDFSRLLAQYYNNPARHYLCGHNIRDFDVPYVCRRLLINGLPSPSLLDVAGKKPWETKHLLDTMDMWRFGDGRSYASLKMLAAVLDFPSPKDDIDGSQVGRVYWEEDGLERITHYCEKDVLATMQLFRRYQLQPLLEDDQVIHV